jgi:hypothetical protein
MTLSDHDIYSIAVIVIVVSYILAILLFAGE